MKLDKKSYSELKDIQNSREKILNFERQLSTLPDVFYGDTDNCPLTHKFAEGIYVREIFIPKGMLVVGKIHKHSHPNFLLKGEVRVFSEGNGDEHLKAPLSIISPPGIKRIVYALEDTIWITVHVTDKTDLDEVEDEVIAKTYKDFDEFRKKLENPVFKMLSSTIKFLKRRR